ncbi:NAD(P)/FAD-dependent oxidoreductase [Hydrogenimonas sp. SS33]|uniref:NAD(P)/FAD-dependent oxidoreductase n=1 Tax=Hydrogenimonas leucolamina TaxID=2954236 RepID=UPI00336C24FF
MRIAVIGGGAAGLMGALTAAKAGGDRVHIDLYESGDEVGRKILASGNGRCNISNKDLSYHHFHGLDPAFVQPALKRFGFDDFRRFCESIGLLLQVREDGRAYPLGNEARSVQRALKRAVERAGVQVVTETPVSSLRREGGTFTLPTPAGPKRYDRILVATGSPAAPQLGGTAGGLELAASLGHTLIPSYPALVGLHLKERRHERMQGVKTVAALTLYIDGRAGKKVTGDLLFTRYGMSGFGVLDISTEASEALVTGRDVKVGADLLPELGRQEITAVLTRFAKAFSQTPVSEVLEGLLPHKIARTLCQSLGLDPSLPAGRLTPKEIRSLGARVKDWRFGVVETHGYRHAEAAGGGVHCLEVDSRTMASKKVEGLYFAGEVLDIVGERGGYNLHFAWASGYLAGLALVK